MIKRNLPKNCLVSSPSDKAAWNLETGGLHIPLLHIFLETLRNHRSIIPNGTFSLKAKGEEVGTWCTVLCFRITRWADILQVKLEKEDFGQSELQTGVSVLCIGVYGLPVSAWSTST